MTDFNNGGVPTPDYDSDDINYIFKKTEFSEDVFVYGKLYADFGGDSHTFNGDVVIFQKNVPTSKVRLHGGTIELTRDPNVYDPADGAFIDFKSTIGEDFDCRIAQTNDNGLRFETGGQGVANTKVTIAPDGKVGIGSTIPTSGLQVNNFFRSQLEPRTLSQPLGANWATESAIVTKGDFGGGISLDDNGAAGYIFCTGGNGNDLLIRQGSVGQTPVQKLEINSDGATDGKIKSFCQVVFYNVTQTQRDALTAQTGGVIYNTSTNKLQCWNGSSWNNLF